MGLYNCLLIIAGMIGAIIAIVGGMKKLVRWVKHCITFFSEIYGDVKAIKEKGQENELSILRLNVISEEMPMSERLEAGEKYIARGGNGGVKQLYCALYEKVNGEKPII